MRKTTSSSVVAGMVSGLPLGLAFAVVTLRRIIPDMRSSLSSYPILVPHMEIILVTLAILVLLMCLAMAGFSGAVGGLIYILALNKIPVDSTYAKAIIPSILVWFIPPAIVVATTYSFQFFIRDLIARDSLALLIFLVLDSSIFAYLFNRWTK